MQRPYWAAQEKTPEVGVNQGRFVPPWPFKQALPLERSGHNMMAAGSIADRDKNVAVSWIVPRFWLTVPKQMPLGKTTLVLSAIAEGPHGTSQWQTNLVTEQAILDVISEPVPTREQLLAVWACAVEVGARLVQWKVTERDKPEYDLLQRLDSVLTVASKKAPESQSALAVQLRDHPKYKANVAVLFEPEVAK